MSYGFLFPGQGSQKIGMGVGFQNNPVYGELFEKANTALGYDLQKLCTRGSIAELTLSENSQPAILTVSIIAHTIFINQYPEIKASFLAGHSLGEYSALVVSGVLDFSDAIKIVHRRGVLMQKAIPEKIGAMAAILGKQDEEVTTLCKDVSTTDNSVSPANFNATGQVVVSGHKVAVERLLKKTKGKFLQVSAPFHCPLMSPIKKEFGDFLSRFTLNDARIPIINNVKNNSQTKNFFESLLLQIDHPVLWKSGVELMIRKGVTKFIEFGEGVVLSGLCKRINKNIACLSIQNLESVMGFQK